MNIFAPQHYIEAKQGRINVAAPRMRKRNLLLALLLAGIGAILPLTWRELAGRGLPAWSIPHADLSFGEAVFVSLAALIAVCAAFAALIAYQTIQITPDAIVISEMLLGHTVREVSYARPEIDSVQLSSGNLSVRLRSETKKLVTKRHALNLTTGETDQLRFEIVRLFPTLQSF
jgi:hypothetical protein